MNEYKIGDIVEFDYCGFDTGFEKHTFRGIILSFNSTHKDIVICAGLISYPESFIGYTWPLENSSIEHVLKQPLIKSLILEYNIHKGYWFFIPSLNDIRKLQLISLSNIVNQIEQELV
jgi:hypothetical protein